MYSENPVWLVLYAHLHWRDVVVLKGEANVEYIVFIVIYLCNHSLMKAFEDGEELTEKCVYI